MAMKFLFLLGALVAGVSAGTVKIGAVRDCGGASATAHFSGQVLTDPVRVPGNMEAVANIDNSVATPDDLTIVKTTVRRSDNYQVPCLDLIAGSCTIPVCATINNFPDLICPNFPAEVPCECPIPAGVFTANLNVPFFATWLNIEGGVTGDYTSKFDLQTRPGVSIGCLEIDFSLVPLA